MEYGLSASGGSPFCNLILLVIGNTDVGWESFKNEEVTLTNAAALRGRLTKKTIKKERAPCALSPGYSQSVEKFQSFSRATGFSRAKSRKNPPRSSGVPRAFDPDGDDTDLMWYGYVVQAKDGNRLGYWSPTLKEMNIHVFSVAGVSHRREALQDEAFTPLRKVG